MLGPIIIQRLNDNNFFLLLLLIFVDFQNIIVYSVP